MQTPLKSGVNIIRMVSLKRARLAGCTPVEALDYRESLTSWPFHVAGLAKTDHLFLI